MGRDIPERVAERAASKYTVNADGCWISDYSAGSHGYAQIRWSEGPAGQFTTTAHRAAWVHHTGELPLDTIDHTCRTRRCVNPAHLRELSRTDNSRRNGPGRDFPLDQACAAGHEESDRVMQTDKRRNGVEHQRMACVKCRRAVRANYRAKKKEAR